MAITQRLELRQGQSLVMTPQLQQAIKLLQLSQIDLASFIEQELEQNPVLSRDEGGESEGTPADPPPPAADERPAAVDREMASDSPYEERSGTIDEGYDNVFGDDSALERATPVAEPFSDLGGGGWTTTGGSGSFDEDDRPADARIVAAVSLRDYLSGQLSELGLTPSDRLAAAALIDSLDEAGYLAEPMDDVAGRLGLEDDALEELITRLQGLDPPGVFARTLRECLEIQCREVDRLDPSMAAVLGRLDLVARGDLNALARIAAVDVDEVMEIIKEIRSLNPKPGLAFDTAPIQAVVPDVYVRPTADGGWMIELNATALPRVLIDRRYAARLSAGGSKADKTYLSDCMASANWLVKALDQRARTIVRVATSLVEQQDAFLRHGVSHLRPMNLKAIAEEIGMHESTVSRVTANKWVWTPRGLYEMKFFFTTAIASADGGAAHSAEAVRHRIRRLIDGETADGILSDDKLVDVLRREGIEIARRTVAKYREGMGIGSSTERRRHKLMAASRS